MMISYFFLRYTKPPFLRIHILSVHHDSKVQMRAGGIAGTADFSDELSSCYCLSFRHIDLAEMTVYCLQASAVGYDNAFTESSVPSCDFYLSCFTCQYMSPCRKGYIKALVIRGADTSR